MCKPADSVPTTPRLLLGILLLCATLLVIGAPHAWTASTASPQWGDCPTTPAKTKSETKDKESTPTKEKDGETTRLFAPLVWGCCDEWKLQFGGEERVRNEHRYNFDMNRDIGDNDKLWFHRTRLNFDLSYCSFLRAFLELADARQPEADPRVQQEAYWHIHQAYLEWRDPQTTPLTVRAGRQEMYLGERRLVDASTWSNLIQTFEGVRLRYKTKKIDLNAFFFQPDYYQRLRNERTVTGPQRPLNRVWFYGLYSTFFHLDPHEYDLYFLGYNDLDDHRTFPQTVQSEDGRFGTTDRYTVGTRWRGPIWKQKECGTLGYGLESAYQFGQRADDEIQAWMIHADINYEWEHPWKPKLTLLGNLASGDRHFGDGESNTFNPLYGSTHGPYGIIDFVRLQNLRELAVTATVKPTNKWQFDVELHKFWLDSPTDAWYSTGGSVVERDVTGRSGRELGDEIDFIARYKINEFMNLEAGAARFFPGNFARRQGRPDPADWLYVQWTFAF